MGDETALGGLLAIVAGLGVFAFIIGCVLYILKSLGLSKMAANRGIENPWLAWLPIADLYLVGTLVEEVHFFDLKIDNLGLWFPLASVLGGILANIPFIGGILLIALLIFDVLVIYNLFKQYTDQATLYTVLSILLGFLWPIFIFTLRDKPVLQTSKPPEF